MSKGALTNTLLVPEYVIGELVDGQWSGHHGTWEK